MVLKLYMHEVSPGVRATLLTSAAMGFTIDEFIAVDLLNREHYGEEFTKRNPARTVPSLDDDGFIVNDSHVILPYLAEKFGSNDSTFYPADIRERAKINYILHYDNSILFPAIYSIAINIYKLISRDPSEEQIEKAIRAYEILEQLLEGKTYTTGDNLTIADFSVITTITSINHLVPIEKKKFPNIHKWIDRMRLLPYYNFNEEGLTKHIKLLEEFRAKFQ